MYKRLYRAGIAAYAVLFILSVLFYKERTMFLDMAYSLFFIIKRNYFAIQNFRYVAILTQVFPLVASRMGLSLNVVAFLYSSGFIFYYFGCYFICGTILKQYRFALVILLFNILFVSHTFYWIQSELPQSIVLLIVIMALMSYRKINELNALMIAIIFLGLMMIQFSHPLMFFPVTYVMLFFLFREEQVIEHRMIYATAIFFYALIQVKKMVFNVYYDIVAMGNSGNVLKRFPHYFNLYSNKRFLLDCINHYYWIPILSAAIVWLYAKVKEWKKLALFVCFTGGYLLLINVSYPGKQVADFYMENLYLPLAIFIALPFVFDIIPVLESKKIALPVLVIILLTGCIRIFLAHTPYSNRLTWERNLVNEYRDKKIVIATAKTPIDTVIMAWGTPYEIWMLSTIENGRTASVIVYDSAHQINDAAQYNKQLLTTWGAIPYDSLPKRYFKLEDTISTYTIAH